MIVRSISIRRDGDYGGHYAFDATKPLRAVIELNGQSGKVELNLSEDMSARVIALIADEVVAAGRTTAEALTAEIFTGAVLAAPEAPAFHYTNSKGVEVPIADMLYPHLLNARDKLAREDKDGIRTAEIEAMTARLAEIDAMADEKADAEQ